MSQQIREAMELWWRSPGVESPLRPACWKVIGDRLFPNNDPVFSDEDDGAPLYSCDTGKS